MSKRFTDTEKWKKHFMKSLSSEYKLLWLYILDDCNHAGIWEVDLDVASLRLGFNYNLDKSIKTLQDKIIIFDNHKKWFIPSFIEFQYGELNEKNTVHKSILNNLRKYNILKYINQGAYNAPLQAPCIGAKDKDMDMDKEKDMEKVKDKDKDVENFIKKWNDMAEFNGLSKIEKITDPRKAKLKTRLRKDPDFKAHYDLAISIIPTRPFLLGDNDRGWKVTFDWLIDNDQNYIKVCEGQYKSNKKNNSDRQAYLDFIAKGDK